MMQLTLWLTDIVAEDLHHDVMLPAEAVSRQAVAIAG